MDAKRRGGHAEVPGGAGSSRVVATNVRERNLSVIMVRHELTRIPRFRVPDGYALRWYRDGDARAWRMVHEAADRYNDITTDLFVREFGADATVLAQRMAFAEDQAREVVGTVAAWRPEAGRAPGWGRVHWLAVHPEHQGRGLGKALLATACDRLRRLGHDRAYLTTSTARVQAIGLYLAFGFEPEIATASDAAAWRDLAPLVAARGEPRQR